jgi:hypothetical protein
MDKDKLTAQQIVDDFFHEYCEGRLDREEMIKTIKKYAEQCIDRYDKAILELPII